MTTPWTASSLWSKALFDRRLGLGTGLMVVALAAAGPAPRAALGADLMQSMGIDPDKVLHEKPLGA